jgi:hypothetical protein
MYMCVRGIDVVTVCPWLVAGRRFSPGTSVSSTNKTDCQVSFTTKTDCHDIAEILLKVALNTITITLCFYDFALDFWTIPTMWYFVLLIHTWWLWTYIFQCCCTSLIVKTFIFVFNTVFSLSKVIRLMWTPFKEFGLNRKKKVKYW